ncbi:MAG: hypothetical protein N0C81_08105 [Candidatus Thiodiazotropha lotti]|uniref:Uncharacterized protein n=1 Tax=Candidatus Thiodiazotropha lotti TaxID=2792787 RepID=A0A9E4K6K6_9GAMM|nr:hypothetical protein [Candidatus Thiodiazotropha lotti]ODB99010.1 hypothetical protein A3197_16580 [Candidatus Thiodiazotropha endoloripes]MCG7921666.1 hypothetical protein [Candidatus Thiodiazotropha lotti]MCG7929768.1 hypothetical protein [Candidatus Thiodiazotropha lotti]MCG7940252.1 hypothetical protein [Candidatus Thiodiazotropha lotti]
MYRRILILIIIGLAVSLPANADRHKESRSNRQKAVTVCNDYRVKNRLPCFVSRNRCPLGFEVLERFNQAPGAEYMACRDLRHERPATLQQKTVVNDKRQRLLQQFDQLVERAIETQLGETVNIPESTLNKLSTFFSQVSLEKITIHRSQAISKGCFNDCQKIYCSVDEPVNRWVEPNSKRISTKLLIQVAHAERCEIQGGRERYITNWLRDLPVSLLDKLRQESRIDASKIRYAKYIEAHAKNRAKSVCRRMLCGD